MDKMTLASKNIVKDTRGQSLAEYCIGTGCIAIVCIIGYKAFGKSVNDKITEYGTSVGQLPGGGK